ncbi:uncharacterized protein [Dermacentor albipictus]|uniref:uncharacterized protein n=1 Tax=Dermacentor albipictus TaxID=60249 RepID=UPI0038FCB4EE
MDKPTLRRDAARRRRCRVALFLLLGYALIVEWLVYLVAPYWNWPYLPLTAGIGTRLLLVADPQLLGRVNTAPGLFGIIERWDADRYISKTFALANDYFKPHVVIFLGDLSDEGELATDDDFRSYVERFFDIFTHIDYSQAIFLPGDNDIGGERKSVGKAELERFNSYFRNDTFLTYRGIDFIKVNYLTTSYAYRSHLSQLGSNVRFVLSHVPLSTSYGRYIKDVVKELRPDVMLAGHRHESVHLVAEQNTGSVEHLELRLGSDRRPVRMDLSAGRLHELRLPPCSYRMGTHWVGFGAAILDPDRVLTYGVLWSPDRLLYLAGYLVVLFVCAVLCLPTVWQLCGSVWCQLCPGKSSRFYSGSFLPIFH